MANIPVFRLRFGDFIGASSVSNNIADTSIATLLHSHLQSYFCDFLIDGDFLPIEEEIGLRIFETVTVMIQNEFNGSRDVEISDETGENELRDDPLYKPIIKKRKERSS